MFHTFDWWIVGIFIGGLIVVALLSKTAVKSVADFLVANRCAGRYLLTTVGAMNFLGATTIIANFQMNYDAGFTATWWQLMLLPIFLIVTFSGWVAYRWRATRIMTQAQLFEIRFSKTYRIFSGTFLLATGVLGLGILPSVGGEFFVNFCHLPQNFELLGFNISSYQVVVISLLLISLFFSYVGGQITVMVCDFLQGVICMCVFLAIFGFIMIKVKWPQFLEGLSYAPAEKSLINPFHTTDIKSYNIWYFLVIAFNMVFIYPVHTMYGPTNASARTPHESHMAQILANIRHIMVASTLILLPLCAFMIMNHPDFSDTANQIKAILAGHTPQIQRQIQVPLAISYLLPIGLLGGFAAVMLAAFINTTSMYFLIFGSVFVQDVVLPFRKKPFEPKTHIWFLRIAIFCVFLVTYLMGFVFEQKQDILMFWAILGALQASAVNIPMLGALYWKKCTTGGAWTAAICGIIASLIALYIDRNIKDFPLNGAQLSFCAIIITMAAFAVGSLIDRWLRKIPDFDMDKLLHRGKYAAEPDRHAPKIEQSKFWLYRILQIDKEFTKGDKIIYFGILGWCLMQMIVFVIGTILGLLTDTTDRGWWLYWKYYMWVSFGISAFVTVWLTVGGIRDMKDLFRRLKQEKVNIKDDGMVINHQNIDEIPRN